MDFKYLDKIALNLLSVRFPFFAVVESWWPIRGFLITEAQNLGSVTVYLYTSCIKTESRHLKLSK